MNAKPHTHKPPENPKAAADPDAPKAKPEPATQALAADALPEPERIERQNDLA